MASVSTNGESEVQVRTAEMNFLVSLYKKRVLIQSARIGCLHMLMQESRKANLLDLGR